MDMTERIQPGQYKVSEEQSSDDRKNTSEEIIYGVIRGEVANEKDYGAIGKQFGFKDSKWYAYKLQRTELIPKVDFSPTAPWKAFKRHFAEVTFAQQEFDTKKEAVKFAENNRLN